MTILCFHVDFNSLFSGIIAGVLSAIILIWGYSRQYKQFKAQISFQHSQSFKTNSVLLIIALEDEFFDKMAKRRAGVADKILVKKVLDKDELDINTCPYEIIRDIEDVLDFFDSLGFYVKEEYIKIEPVRENFYHWIHHYHWFYIQYKLKAASKREERTWKNFEWLKQKLDKIEVEEFGSIPELNHRKLERFFREEGE